MGFCKFVLLHIKVDAIVIVHLILFVYLFEELD